MDPDLLAGPRKSNARQRSATSAGVKMPGAWPAGVVVTLPSASVGEEESRLPPLADGATALAAALPALTVSAASPEPHRRTPRAPVPESPPAPELPWASAVCAPGDDADCVVCMDADRDTRLLPCLHCAFCAPCAAALLATHAPALCPLCRIPVTGCEAAM